MKKLTSLFLALLLLLSMAGCAPQSPQLPETTQITTDAIVQTTVPETTVPETTEPEVTEPPTEKPTEPPATGLTYKDEVAAYIHTYHCLPSNFITKSQAKNRFGSTAPKVLSKNGYCIGGDRFYNNEGLLPDGQTYYECDIGTLYSTSGSRGSKRLVYTKTGIVYYTSDHYRSFTRLY